MKLRYDSAVDALYIRLAETAIVESEEVQPGVVLDYDAEDRVVGIEVLDVQRRLPEAQLKRLEFEAA